MHEAFIGEHEELISELTTLIARDCDAEKMLSEHHRLHGGYCACSTPNVPRPWPCALHVVAERTHELVAASRPRGARGR